MCSLYVPTCLSACTTDSLLSSTAHDCSTTLLLLILFTISSHPKIRVLAQPLENQRFKGWIRWIKIPAFQNLSQFFFFPNAFSWGSEVEGMWGWVMNLQFTIHFLPSSHMGQSPSSSTGWLSNCFHFSSQLLPPPPFSSSTVPSVTSKISLRMLRVGQFLLERFVEFQSFVRCLWLLWTPSLSFLHFLGTRPSALCWCCYHVQDKWQLPPQTF